MRGCFLAQSIVQTAEATVTTPEMRSGSDFVGHAPGDEAPTAPSSKRYRRLERMHKARTRDLMPAARLMMTARYAHACMHASAQQRKSPQLQATDPRAANSVSALANAAGGSTIQGIGAT